MKIILLDHIDKIGRKGEIVSVKRGFARNYLVPRNLALYATPQNMKQVNTIQVKAAEEEEKIIAELKKLDAKIRKLTLVFLRKVDENEHMFGSVSETDISHRLSEEGVDVHKSAILLEKHIKELGTTMVQIRLHKDIVSELNVIVEKENKEIPVVEELPVVEEEEVLTEDEPETEQEPETEKLEDTYLDDEI